MKRFINDMKNINFYNVFTSKIFVLVLVVCLMMGVIQVSTGYRDEILRQEQEMFLEDDIPSISYYYDESINLDYSDNMAIADMIDCYQENVDIENISNEVKSIINELDALYSSNSRAFSFLYYDLFSGVTVSYNENKPIFTASTIKAPAMIYIYEMASLGKIDLNEELVYTSNFYHGGSGVLKTKSVNTKYTIEELLQYTIYESDNIAYSMLMNRYGRENIRKFWQEKFGTEYIFTNNTIWGYMSANDALIYMKELYRFSLDNDEYGGKLLDHFKRAKWKLITDKDGKYNTANKGGWSGTAIHDIAIVFDKNPYVLVIMSNLGEGGYIYHFDRTSKLVGKLHEEYWKYKESICGNIKLY